MLQEPNEMAVKRKRCRELPRAYQQAFRWFLGWKGASGFSTSLTTEQVTHRIHGTSLTAIITGVSSGLGLKTTRVLALRGVHVVMAVRNVKNGLNIKETLLKEIPNAKIDVFELDISSLASVSKFAADKRKNVDKAAIYFIFVSLP
ncbi:Short-chain dehydrogenase TIC 32, chloroplastic [Trifolium repens]|nr:Short-chain dehydrogenase TIC 32, chloroplastic [Trifolium repens]